MVAKGQHSMVPDFSYEDMVTTPYSDRIYTLFAGIGKDVYVLNCSKVDEIEFTHNSSSSIDSSNGSR